MFPVIRNRWMLCFQAFQRAFEAQPDSLPDWYITQLFNASSVRFSDDPQLHSREEPFRHRGEWRRNLPIGRGAHGDRFDLLWKLYRQW